MDGFACPRCDSPSVALPDCRQEDAHVVCRHCGALIGTLSQYRRNIERHIETGYTHSGC
jgi:hypothetical protein